MGVEMTFADDGHNQDVKRANTNNAIDKSANKTGLTTKYASDDVKLKQAYSKPIYPSKHRYKKSNVIEHKLTPSR